MKLFAGLCTGHDLFQYIEIIPPNISAWQSGIINSKLRMLHLITCQGWIYFQKHRDIKVDLPQQESGLR
jgi:hypothetical protein